jgi:hypothetical protein
MSPLCTTSVRPSAALDADQLLGASLLVLQAADGEGATPYSELLADALERLQGGDLLLVHPVDPNRTVAIGLVARAFTHHEVFRSLLDFHGRRLAENGLCMQGKRRSAAFQKRESPRRSARDLIRFPVL